jgi:NAD(P)H-flavin reductase
VRYANEAYEREEYEPSRFFLCTSRDDDGDYRGRLTGYLKEAEFEKNSCFYLCGNSDMIFDAMEILKEKGFSRDDVNVEVYF